MTSDHYAHRRAPDQVLGLHYTAFRPRHPRKCLNGRGSRYRPGSKSRANPRRAASAPVGVGLARAGAIAVLSNARGQAPRAAANRSQAHPRLLLHLAAGPELGPRRRAALSGRYSRHRRLAREVPCRRLGVDGRHGVLLDHHRDDRRRGKQLRCPQPRRRGRRRQTPRSCRARGPGPAADRPGRLPHAASDLDLRRRLQGSRADRQSLQNFHVLR